MIKNILKSLILALSFLIQPILFAADGVTTLCSLHEGKQVVDLYIATTSRGTSGYTLQNQWLGDFPTTNRIIGKTKVIQVRGSTQVVELTGIANFAGPADVMAIPSFFALPTREGTVEIDLRNPTTAKLTLTQHGAGTGAPMHLTCH